MIKYVWLFKFVIVLSSHCLLFFVGCRQSFASASADNIKKFSLPKGEFFHNMLWVHKLIFTKFMLLEIINECLGRLGDKTQKQEDFVYISCLNIQVQLYFLIDLVGNILLK